MNEIERQLVQMQQEYNGQRESHKGGRGPVYSLVQEGINTLRAEQNNVDARIDALNRRIALVDTRKSEDPAARTTRRGAPTSLKPRTSMCSRRRRVPSAID